MTNKRKMSKGIMKRYQNDSDSFLLMYVLTAKVVKDYQREDT